MRFAGSQAILVPFSPLWPRTIPSCPPEHPLTASHRQCVKTARSQKSEGRKYPSCGPLVGHVRFATLLLYTA